MTARPAGETGGPNGDPRGGPNGHGASQSPLISVGELARELADGTPPVLLDVRWRLGGPPGVDSYRAGHVPGAGYVDLDRQLAGPPGEGGRHPLPAADEFEAAMTGAGVTSDASVVVYDDSDATIAARLWWMLRYYGHERVRVLDGGFRAWADAGEPVSTDASATKTSASETTATETSATETAAGGAGKFRARPGQLPVIDADGAARLAETGILLDARAPARYRGETEPVDRVAGHIPGALSAPTAENVTAEGTFRPAADLRARFASLGVAPGDGHAVGVYCGSGVTAAHEVLALALTGVPAALYVGSWSGWVADPTRPVATGPRP
jgi:thiosulfate/3-mercaptopyruvate sulfurtransferase